MEKSQVLKPIRLRNRQNSADVSEEEMGISEKYSSEDEEQLLFKCCTPRTCKRPGHLIDGYQPGDAVKVVCNNEECKISPWMHKLCFEDWEEHVLVFLKSCGRARSWNEKQRVQNLWTKKGYDLAYKACNCSCGKGHLRKDLDFVQNSDEDGKRPKASKKNEKLLLCPSSKTQPIPMSGTIGGVRPRIQLRPRAMSLSSTGSSPPMSASPDSSPPSLRSADKINDKRFEFPLTTEQAAAGNIFHHRPNLHAFKKLPAYKRNPYHIKMEDEGPYGNDETRCFVLASLSTRRVTSIPCVVCGQDLKIFDRYPLIDGTLFLSPLKYISDVSLLANGQTQYMNAVCMMCAEGLSYELRCKQCLRPWNGSALQIGTMYSYDVFAAEPCCLRRLLCKNCGHIAVETGQNIPFFSQFSRIHTCCQCKATGYHFVKPLNEIFNIHRC